MTTRQAAPADWWETIPPGRIVSLAFIKIDRAGSTQERRELPEDDVRRIRRLYRTRVEDVARAAGAPPLHWQGDGAMILVPDGETPAPVLAYRVAKNLWQRVRIDLNLPARMAVHAAHVTWNPDTGTLDHPALDLCGHLEAVAPENSIVVTEDVYLTLPEPDRLEMARLGITVRDRIPAYVFPASAAGRRPPDAFVQSRELDLWDAFRTYATSPQIALLRYVGFRLRRAEPPCLDVRDVFVPPLVEVLETSARAGLSDPYRRPGDEKVVAPKRGSLKEAQHPQPPVLFDALFRDHRGLVILGDPGSGKTTLLRWLAVMAAGGRWTLWRALGRAERLLPLIVSVGRLSELRTGAASHGSVVEGLARYFDDRTTADRQRIKPFLEERLENGDCLVLFDGLDEVKTEDRQAAASWLEGLGGRFPRNRFVVTSRIVGFAGFQLPTGKVATLAPFRPFQVERYVRSFVTSYSRSESRRNDHVTEHEEADRLLQVINKNPRLKGLAGNPFLLSGLALIHRAEGQLPRYRVHCYEMFARCLCESWGTVRRLVAGRQTPDIPYEEEALPMLGQLALAMHEAYPTGVAPEGFVLQTLERALVSVRGLPIATARQAAREFLKKAGEEVQILLPKGPDEWGFLHLTFQEFFVASGLHAADSFEKEGFKHLFDPRWEEVLRLGVGYMALVQNRYEAARRFVMKVLEHKEQGSRSWITEVLGRQVTLAALLASEVGHVLPDSLRSEVARRLTDWALTTSPFVSHRVLKEFSNTEFRLDIAPHLTPKLAELDKASDAATLLGFLKAETALDDLGRVMITGDPIAQWRAAEAIGRIRSPAAVALLLEALQHSDEHVRASAASGLGETGEEAAIQPLINAVRDHSKLVRVIAIRALGTLRASAAVTVLAGTFDETDEGLRAAAAVALGRIGLDDLPPALLGAAQSEDESKRSRAVQLLGATHHKDALPHIRRAVTDDSPAVRASAVSALAELQDAESLSSILKALSDDSPLVRAEAAQAAGRFPCKEAVHILIKLLENPDEDVQVRFCAAEALGELGDPIAVKPLIGSLDDPSPFVRDAAAVALALLKSAESFQPLVAMLESNRPDIADSAAAALGELRGEEAVEPLLRLLERTTWEPFTRAITLEALWKISELLPAPKRRSKARSGKTRQRRASH